MAWWIINGVYIFLICLLYYNVTTNINSLNRNLLQNTSQITHRPIQKHLFVFLLNNSLFNVIKKTFYFYYCTQLRAPQKKLTEFRSSDVNVSPGYFCSQTNALISFTTFNRRINRIQYIIGNIEESGIFLFKINRFR